MAYLSAVNEITANKTIDELDQSMKLIFQFAWGRNGTWHTRILATIITLSVAIRILTNAAIFSAIVKQPALRASKEHLLMAYISFYDVLDGGWYFCMVALEYGTHRRLDCFLTFRHALFFAFGGQSATLMLAAASLDRILAVGFPVWFWKQGPTLSHRMGLGVGLYSLLFGGYLASIPIRKPDDLVPYCFTSHTFQEGFDHDSIMRRVWLAASIVMYGSVLFLFKLHMHSNKIEATAGGANNAVWLKEKRIQRKMTVTLGLSAVVTGLFHIAPLSAWHWLRKAFPQLQQLGYVLFAITSWSSTANIFLFGRHKEFRMALKALFSRGTLPKRLDQWSAAASRPHTMRPTNGAARRNGLAMQPPTTLKPELY